MSAIWASWTPGYTCWVRYVLTLVISQHPRLCKWWCLEWGLPLWVLGLESTSQQYPCVVLPSRALFISYYHSCIRLSDLLLFRYVINTAIVYLRFVYLCARLFLGHIWVFYASYFVFLKYVCDKLLSKHYWLSDASLVRNWPI